MRRSLLALVPLLGTLSASPSHAADTTWDVLCSGDLVADLTGVTDDPYHHRGYFYGVAYAHDGTDLVGITVTCTLKLDYSPIVRLDFAGDGAAADATTFDYTGSTDLQTCVTVAVDDGTPGRNWCAWSDPTAIPPYEVVRLGADVMAAAGLTAQACAVTASLPDVGRVLRSEDDGDLYRDGYPVWACP